MAVEPEQVDLDFYRKIDEEHTRTLEFEPGKLYIKETIRPKYGLKDNLSLPKEVKAVLSLLRFPLLPFIAEVLLQKYEYHVPFYRQVKEYRHLGIRLFESTLSGWFKPACKLLKPLYDELRL